ncbi:AraC family transcriptional regulator [Metabacillus sp. 84]|uniref:AraC family transcriptional regulator n=1 Tax=Metabacillus sp. 84 TaxID=3404705 RepID=UPI003CF2260E
MKFIAETLPDYRIAYMRRVGPYGSANIGVMENLKKWANEKNLLESSIIFAIPHDNPELTLPENCRYDACIVIPNDFQINHSICESELSGGKYLVFEVNHTAEDIHKAYKSILTAVQRAGYQIDHKPIMERYTYNKVQNHYCEICVPIKS